MVRAEKRCVSALTVASYVEGFSMHARKLLRKQLFCPRRDRGVFMADHGDFWLCGKCGDRYNKDIFGERVVEAHAGM